ncbi:LOW QUALITY PROTEIN: proprotein convertase subtilisin/kexin type 6-like [Salvelinus alpinus]
MCLFFILILSTLEICQSLAPRNVYTNHWAVRIAGGQEEADKLAVKYGYNNYGQIGSLEDHYHFHHSRVVRRAAFSTRGAHSFIQMDPKVDWVQQQLVKQRVKRYIQRDTRSPDPNFVHFNDPKWSNMWYIHCTDKNNRCRSEMNILAAWQRGYTGKNVVVTILDDGIERNHPDLAQNYDQLASYDVNGNDHDPTPRYDSSNENKHGTRCAGEVAAVANNSHCIVGIAYNARIGGIRMLDGDVTDVVEAKSLGIRPDYIDIYSASWGPDDDGKTVDGPGPLAKQAFEMGIKKGRKGLGSIFVWASGNGGRQGDHCSCDGYTNSIYTISISSTTENGNKPWYLEVCSSTLATTYSSGEFYDRKILTTDLRQRCTDGHTGTSVSAPMVAGVIALALEANPLVSWRDIQHLLVKTSRPVHLKANDWETNAAGHRVSHLYGFGLVDAEGMVVEAKKWRSVPTQHTCTRMSERRTSYFLSPSLSLFRLFDNSNEGFRNWEFMTVHCWGERAEGQWILEIIDSPSSLRNPEVLGKLKEWTLVLYGTSGHPYQSHGTQHSRSRMLEIPSPSRDPNEPEPPPEGLKHQEEEEEDYSGPCHSECGDQGCDGPDPDHCLNCIHYSLGSLKTGRTCVSHCPLGFYDNLEARRCRRCHKGCERCVGRTPTECRSCRRGLYFNPLNATCSETCPAGYFADDIQRKCLRCHENCMKCLRDSDRCTACNDGYSLAGMTCVPECANGTFFHLEEMKCSPCHTSCSTCTGHVPVTPPALPAQVSVPVTPPVLPAQVSVPVTPPALPAQVSDPVTPPVLPAQVSVPVTPPALPAQVSVPVTPPALPAQVSVPVTPPVLPAQVSVPVTPPALPAQVSDPVTPPVLPAEVSVPVTPPVLPAQVSVPVTPPALPAQVSVPVTPPALPAQVSVPVTPPALPAQVSVPVTHPALPAQVSVPVTPPALPAQVSVPVTPPALPAQVSVPVTPPALPAQVSVPVTPPALPAQVSVPVTPPALPAQVSVHVTPPALPAQVSVPVTPPALPAQVSVPVTPPALPAQVSVPVTPPALPAQVSVPVTRPALPAQVSVPVTPPALPAQVSVPVTSPALPAQVSVPVIPPALPAQVSVPVTPPALPAQVSVPVTHPALPAQVSVPIIPPALPAQVSVPVTPPALPAQVSVPVTPPALPAQVSVPVIPPALPAQVSVPVTPPALPAQVSDRHTSCSTCTGPGKEECIQCARDHLQQEWRCVQTCAPGYYSTEDAGYHQGMCHKSFTALWKLPVVLMFRPRCEENCLSCDGPGTTCVKCKDSYNLVSRTCMVNATCNNADEVFCEMVKSNRLCEKKLFRQFCCRTCLMTG